MAPVQSLLLQRQQRQQQFTPPPPMAVIKHPQHPHSHRNTSDATRLTIDSSSKDFEVPEDGCYYYDDMNNNHDHQNNDDNIRIIGTPVEVASASAAAVFPFEEEKRGVEGGEQAEEVLEAVDDDRGGRRNMMNQFLNNATTTIVGRDNELAMLHGIYNKIIISSSSSSISNNATTTTTTAASSSSTVFLSGYSGSGKSHLVDAFVNQLLHSRRLSQSQNREDLPPFLFLSTKFESIKRRLPFSAIGSLFEENIFHNINNYHDGTEEEEEDLTLLLKDAYFELCGKIGEHDASILLRVFPSLRNLLLSREGNNQNQNIIDDSYRSTTGVSMSGRSSLDSRSVSAYLRKIDLQRLHFVCRSFFSTLTRPKKRYHGLPLIRTDADEPSQQPQTQPAGVVILLFMDDLQWADQHSLDLIKELFIPNTSATTNSSCISNMMFIGSYRSNEVDEGHPLTSTMNEIRNHGNSNSNSNSNSNNSHSNNFYLMELQNLQRQDVAMFLAEAMKLSSSNNNNNNIQDLSPLADALYTKTLGNPFFIIQAIQQLIRSNVLDYDSISWDDTQQLEDQISRILSDMDVIDMIQNKIKDMAKPMQKLLVIASLVGSKFDVGTIVAIVDAEHDECVLQPKLENTYRSSIIRILNDAVSQGLLEVSSSRFESAPGGRGGASKTSRRGSSAHRRGSSKSTSDNHIEFSFVHDKVQEAAANLIQSEEQRHSLCRIIGTTLAELGRRRHHHYHQGDDDGDEMNDEYNWMLFVAANHLNSIPFHNTDDSSSDDNNNTRLRLSELNHMVAEISLSLLAFGRAVEYVEHALRYLPDSPSIWYDHYELVLNLHTIGAEAERKRGNVEKAEFYCQEVLDRQDIGTTNDKMTIYKVKLDILAGNDHPDEALDVSLSILQQLGHAIPVSERGQRIKAWADLQITKSKYIPDNDTIECMPFATDGEILETMDLIERAGSFAYSLNKVPLYVVFRCKLVRWMMRYGLTEYSGSAIASFSNLLMHVYGDFGTGKALAELAMKIQERLNCKYTSTRTLNTANRNVLGWVYPLKTRIQYHLQAYEAGMVSGNIEGAVIGRMFSYWVHLYSSLPLKALEEDCSVYVPRMRQMGCNFYADLCSLIWQSALNLMGASSDTTIMTGSAMDEDEYLKKPIKHSIAVRKSFLWVYFGEWRRGADDALERGDSYLKAFVGGSYGFESFYRGICLYAMARKTNLAKYKAPAEKIRSQIQNWVRNGCTNLIHLLHLLDAEHYALKGKRRKAEGSYQDAIARAFDDDFFNDAGLSCERYADYLEASGERIAAIKQISRAINHYSRWGAKKKVEMLFEILREQRELVNSS